MRLHPKALAGELRFNDLRHSEGTMMLRAGADAHRVQRILRHADIRTTLGTYGHLDVEDLRGAVDSIAPVTEAATEEIKATGTGGHTEVSPFGPRIGCHRERPGQQ